MSKFGFDSMESLCPKTCLLCYLQALNIEVMLHCFSATFDRSVIWGVLNDCSASLCTDVLLDLLRRRFK